MVSPWWQSLMSDIYYTGTRTGDYPFSCGLVKFDGVFTPYKQPDAPLVTDLGAVVPYGQWSIHGLRFPVFSFGIHKYRFGYYTGWNDQLQFTYSKSSCSPWLNADPRGQLVCKVSYLSYIDGQYKEFGTFRSGNWWYATSSFDRLDFNIGANPYDMASHIDYKFYPVDPAFWEVCHSRRKRKCWCKRGIA